MTETLHKVQLDGNNNVILQHVNANNIVIETKLDWDTFVQRYTYEQRDRIEELQKLLARSEKLFDLEKLQLSQQLNELQAEVERREAQVKQMIQEYADKDLRQTDARYRQAFELFLAAKLDEALAVLDDAKLEAELRKAEETKRQVAESYRLKADILQLQYDFKAAEAYLHRALRAYPDWGNCLTLANFYQNLNQFPEAEQHYKQCLELANDEEELATTLNNLAILQRAKNEFSAAEKSYLRALEIREQLAEVNPQTYLPDVAMTLNNLAVLQSAKNEFSAAEKSYLRALEIYEQLAEVNPQTYLPYVATTLNNLAVLQSYKNEFSAAEKSYLRALDIRRAFAEAMPQAYDLPVCETSLNLIIFYFGKFQNGNGTEEDAAQFVALLTDVEMRLQRFPTEIPLVQRMWEAVNHYKQFLTEEA